MDRTLRHQRRRAVRAAPSPTTKAVNRSNAAALDQREIVHVYRDIEPGSAGRRKAGVRGITQNGLEPGRWRASCSPAAGDAYASQMRKTGDDGLRPNRSQGRDASLPSVESRLAERLLEG